MPRSSKKDADGLYQRPDSPCWWATFTDARGRRARRSTGTSERAEAEVILAGWRLEASRGLAPAPAQRPTFDGLMLTWLQATEPDKRPLGHRRAIDATRRLREHFSGRTLEGLGAADVRGYIARRREDGVSAATINRELAVLSSAINFARREWEWDVPNPVAGRKLREPEGRLRWLTRAEAERVIAAAEAGDPQSSGHLPDLIRLALHTGMRKGELLNLVWTRVDFDARILRLEGEHTKTRRRRSIPLNGTARAVLARRAEFSARHCPTSPWVWCHANGARITDVKRSFASALAAAGIEDFHFHDLRHTCAAWLVTAGVPLPEIRDLLGHTTVRMTERYAHLAPERVRAAVEVLESTTPP